MQSWNNSRHEHTRE